ncbi:hypothetical protein [Haloplasma contractile]|uniref:Uncharacterized protein n=1 Tax=Haloplasma contractile SSD-17B TaxID=1033810 RepID=U2DR32_9MOLU|nr:hypothetical protein [Haloplasma contractile]ERJ11022.1 hypothetical protein HLPCO_002913 [Haloplasma contractile SSD-17B]
MSGFIYKIFSMIFKLFQIILNKLLKIIVFTTIGIIAIIILLYKDENPSAADHPNVDMQNYINIKVESEMQKLITGTADSISIGTPEEIINREINQYLLEQYDSNAGYIYEDEYYRIQDVWVELDKTILMLWLVFILTHLLL